MSVAERISLQEMFVVLLRIIVGCVFIFASIDKISDPQAFAASINNYRIISGSVALLVATILPWVELLSGLGVLLGVFARGSAFLTLTMLVAFTALVLSAMFRGLDISCGCFTQDPAAGKIGWMKIGENAILVLMNVLVFRAPEHRYSIERLFQSRLPARSKSSVV